MPHESMVINIHIKSSEERFYDRPQTGLNQNRLRKRFWVVAVPALKSKERVLAHIREYENILERELGYRLKERFVKDYPSLKKKYYSQEKEELRARSLEVQSPLTLIISWYKRVKSKFLGWWFRQPTKSLSVSEEIAVIQGLSFKINILRYSSLDAELSITPWGLASKLLDLNILRIGLDEFLPQAFVATIPDADPNRLRFDIDIPAPDGNGFYETVDVENGGGVRRMSTNENPKASGPEYYRKVIQATFLVPTLLALGVLYIAFNRLMDWGTRQNDDYKEIINAQKQIIEEDRTRFQLLFDRLVPAKQENTSANSNSSVTRPPPAPKSSTKRNRRNKPRKRATRPKRRR